MIVSERERQREKLISDNNKQHKTARESCEIGGGTATAPSVSPRPGRALIWKCAATSLYCYHRETRCSIVEINAPARIRLETGWCSSAAAAQKEGDREKERESGPSSHINF